MINHDSIPKLRFHKTNCLNGVREYTGIKERPGREAVYSVNKIRIWGEQIPFNKPERKFKDEVPLMDRSELQAKMQEFFAAGDDPNRDPVIRRQVVMQDEIGKWGAKWTYEDEPFLLPYPVVGSRHALILVPGGAYVMKSMEHEGTEVAALLNEAGI